MTGSRTGLCVAVMVLTALMTAGCGGPGAVSPAPSVLPGTPAGSAVASSTPSTPAPPVVSSSPASPSSRSPASAALRPGSHGADVLALQQRLVALGYWLGTPDGSYGSATTHAVTAFQKTAGLSRDGTAGSAVLAALDRATRSAPRSAVGCTVEVDLTRQVLLLAVDGRVQWVFDTSTGRVPGTTPTGHFTVLRQVDGYDQGPLGVLYRPKYFNGGVAIHGYPSVPPYPASHGCVRVTDAAIDWLWTNNALPLGQPVWVYQ